MDERSAARDAYPTPAQTVEVAVHDAIRRGKPVVEAPPPVTAAGRWDAVRLNLPAGAGAGSWHVSATCSRSLASGIGWLGGTMLVATGQGRDSLAVTWEAMAQKTRRMLAELEEPQRPRRLQGDPPHLP